MFQTKIVEKIKNHILCSITFVENRAVYEIKWKNIVEPGRPQVTIWRMRVASWISKATNTQLAYVITIDFPLPGLLHERAYILCCTYIAYLVYCFVFMFIF